ncbi:MAG: replication-associated recombination protein A [Candidatus Colwellbacteria bacterium]|nr:replication-associated recombination protein A [Candidatus Colwellbacteria bacterium]
MDLFEDKIREDIRHNAPLADRMRPERLDDFMGQADIVGQGKILRSAIERDEIPSMIFWGPPGCGKTSLAKVIAKLTKSVFVEFSAATGGVKEVKAVIAEADERRRLHDVRTIFFADEIHRFNKSQQDTFLPFVENGTITLIGATTENPSFEVNSALLSRCRVFVLKALDAGDIEALIMKALSDKERGLGKIKVNISAESIRFLADMANGDARSALNALDLAVKSSKKLKNGTAKISDALIKDAFQKNHLLYDRAGEEHYNIISALHKSMRGGDADASIYWLGRMLEAGEEPLYIARRIIRFASEDIGIANPAALTQAVAAYQACHLIGMPECGVNLAQAVVYMAKCPKSNALYKGYQAVQDDIKNLPNEPVPIHLRNAPTKLMKNIGYGKGYKYNPDYKGKVEQDYLPEKLKERKYFS